MLVLDKNEGKPDLQSWRSMQWELFKPSNTKAQLRLFTSLQTFSLVQIESTGRQKKYVCDSKIDIRLEMI